MKRYLSLLCLTLAILPLGGCYDEIENDLNLLERRISKLEQRCEQMNTTLEGLSSILNYLDNFDFLTGVDPIYEDGEVAGYVLKFSHSNPVTLYNGHDAGTPILGVGKGDDGLWYWTVLNPGDSEPSFITDNLGNKVSASAGSPDLKIENGYWMVSYDNGESWGNLGKATGEDGKSYFQSVTDLGDYVLFSLLNGTSFQVPTWAAFEKLQEACRRENENLASFTKLVADFTGQTYVKDMIPILQGTDTIGFRLQLSDGNDYRFYNGTGTNVPVISARQDTTSGGDARYWSIQYGTDSVMWILDERGAKIQANAPDGLTPKLSLQQVSGDSAWYWAVAYGDGQPAFILYNGAKVKASVDVPSPVVTRVVSVTDNLVCISLTGGQTIYVPLGHAVAVVLSAPVTSSNTLQVAAGDTVSFSCTVTGSSGEASILPVAEGLFYAAAETTDHITWTVTVHAPSPFQSPSTGRLSILVSDGHGNMKTVVITILPLTILPLS